MDGSALVAADVVAKQNNWELQQIRCTPYVNGSGFLKEAGHRVIGPFKPSGVSYMGSYVS